MPSTMPLRIGDDLLSSARVAAESTGRSAAQQIGYWAKLGRELERSGSVSVREVAEVLAGARAYDDLDPKAQAAVRAEWSERIDAALAALDLATEFTAEGRSWVELAPDGTTIRHAAPAATTRPQKAPAGKQAPRKKPTSRSSTGKKATAKKVAPRATAPKRPAKQAAKKTATRQVAAKQTATKAAATTRVRKAVARTR